MKQIVFSKLRVRNFLTFGDNPVELTIQPGLNLITGDNLDAPDSKNGVGKSTLVLESISFLLFGETFRDIKNSLIPHNGTKQVTSVEGWFKVNDDEYEITRTLNPSKLFLKKNGIDITRTIPETNKDIVQILGISKDILRNTIVMTNNDNIPFFKQNTTSRSKFIEGILSLDVFSRMFEDIKSILNEKNKEHARLETKLQEMRRNIDADRKYAETHRAKHDDNLSKLRTKLEEYKNIAYPDKKAEIDSNNSQIQELQGKIERAYTQEQKAKAKLTTLNASLQQMNAEIHKLKTNTGECPTCKRAYASCDDRSASEDRLKVLTVEVDKVSQDIKSIRSVIKQISDRMDIWQTAKDKLEQANRGYGQYREQYLQQQAHIAHLEQSILDGANYTCPFAEKIIDTASKITKLEQDILISYNYIKILEAAKHVASPTGVKTLVTNKIIDLFNDRLNYYLQLLDAPCRIVLDDMFQETFIHNNGQHRVYGNYSGGEAKRIDFALLFTFRDIRRLQSNISVNVSVMDEIFDGSLDAIGIQKIVEILKNASESTGDAYYVISHRQDAIDQQACNVIRLQKLNGSTTIVDNSSFM